MFIGHYGAGFAATKLKISKTAGRPSLGTYFLAGQFLDVLWPVFILLGIEKIQIDPSGKPFQVLHFTYYPFSHSLLAAFVWSAMFGLFYFFMKKNKQYALLLACVVLSHWVLDLISHVPDLKIMPGLNYSAGLGLWYSVTLTVIIEGAIFLGGVFLYLTATKSKNKMGNILFWALIIFLSVIYTLSIIGPPPTSVTAVAVSGFSQWLIIGWGYWIDRNRTVA